MMGVGGLILHVSVVISLWDLLSLGIWLTEIQGLFSMNRFGQSQIIRDLLGDSPSLLRLIFL